MLRFSSKVGATSVGRTAIVMTPSGCTYCATCTTATLSTCAW